MAYTTVNKSSSFMNTKLFTGNSGTQALTGVGFQPDWTWIKARDGTYNHHTFDAVRGVTKSVTTNESAAETTISGLTAFGTDGFTLGSNSQTNNNTYSFASWNWKAGTAVSGNTGGSGSYKTYTGSVNTTSGFSIIKYEGNGTNGMTIPHHLGVAPKMIITKNLSATGDWYTYHQAVGNTKTMLLNQTNAESGADIGFWNNTSPTSSVFSVGSSTAVNGNGNSIIAYCFAEVQGYSRIGSFTVNGNSTNMIYTGFRPSFLLMKQYSSTSGNAQWGVFDNTRAGYNGKNNFLYANTDAVADSSNAQTLDFLSNGFRLYGEYVSAQAGQSNIYYAVGQTLVGTNGITNNAR